MKKAPFLIALCLVMTHEIATAQTDHSMHSGSGGSGAACQKLKLQKNKLIPPPLTVVPPGSEISFMAFGVDDPEHLEVTVKKIPVEITTEFKDTFYLVHGKLPPELKNTAARLNVKLRGKTEKCIFEDGWLVKIGP
ncbi:MAG: hypothetical protein Q7U98_10460 [Methylicorpusculum sp.]|uniref:hypothetical protein n=1 Tax=Methylicorpusculum sp. TaxID=2713644 RepID=UPI00272085DD|nr:hypothetical protein [Methylicorpusculum sp.]MDO8846083.1 hypothetical protein [Methylicorpusculum sp.]MDO8939569.1 hypothetical protein [Methylicorpusculum sp.]MDO9238405.1 hypothetical protein [Methylicorpusculum sp.]MDP2178020.1 hypothetical protein [Methylicorpusculum sp.]MDP2201854.1 hypothetical protein [Methylicorpusculum sp.]